MDFQHYKERLLDREQELLDEIGRFGAEARESRTSDVEDPIDMVTSDEAKATNYQLEDVANRNLQQVRAGLQRIEAGSYGFCIDCGREIEPARLEAVPWTAYCLEDQEKHDQTAAEDEDTTLSVIA